MQLLFTHNTFVLYILERIYHWGIIKSNQQYNKFLTIYLNICFRIILSHTSKPDGETPMMRCSTTCGLLIRLVIVRITTNLHRWPEFFYFFQESTNRLRDGKDGILITTYLTVLLYIFKLYILCVFNK